ncbi:hypothetical protein SAMN05444395_101154 [Flavobacterium fryxellicola]|uniref:Uncharacterized protein n=1 Tax=Flavobacterium fryxellicola TaxID=249352 RepID=A0A167U2N5_9FLAO|nr:hypothetical protein [Flavobacterium fryxellicola]OAB25199.1 hypothetical protein FBFR_16095 [Flavobacterium fryxellicola]SHN50395.1 hypothetical protein SAMN05444395_101154 [Flavobacterium fryxellicola]
MKKIFFIAAFAVSGLVIVSCDADAIDSTTAQSKEFAIQKENLKSMENDSISIVNTSTVNASKGPGDEIIIITPPKNPQ